MGAARKLTPLKTMSRALVKAVARLDPDEAVARLAAYHAAEPPGMRRRALLAARIELIRKAMEAPPKAVVAVVAEPEPVPVVEPPPPVVIVPPKPMSKGVVTSINLEAVAKMLMAAPEPEPEAAPEPEAPSGAVAMQDVAAAFAALDWGDAAEQVEVSADGEAALWADLTGSGGGSGLSNPEMAGSAPGTARPGREKAGAMDLSAAFAALGGAEAEESPPEPVEEKPAAFDLAAQFAAMGVEEAVEASAPVAGMDTAFALLGDLEGAPEVEEDAPAAMNLAAQFAEMEEVTAVEAEAVEAPAPVAGMDVAFALLGDLEGAPEVAEGAPAAMDLAAQFAEMEEVAAVEAEAVEAPAPVAGMDAAFALLGDLEYAPEVAEGAPAAMDLAAQFAEMEEVAAVEADDAEAPAPVAGMDVPQVPDLVEATAGSGDGERGGLEAGGPTGSAPETPLLDEDGVELSALQLAMLRRAQRRAAEG